MLDGRNLPAGLVVSFQTVPLDLNSLVSDSKVAWLEQDSRQSRKQAGIITGCRREQAPPVADLGISF
jgi:hypothetical protein